ncbi:MAG: RICIN domain-containing protein, partial [Arachnia sp.]
MTRSTSSKFAAVAGAFSLVMAGAVLQPPGAQADVGTSEKSFAVSVGSTGAYPYPTDTPAAPFIAKDGTFYFQQSAAEYGIDEPREWEFYTGRDFDNYAKDVPLSGAVNPADPRDRNDDTTWRCNNSPTGLESTDPPAGSRYSQKNYCDLLGVWVDPDTGDWYGLVHNEFTPEPFGDRLHYDAIDYAVSTDQGYTWTIKDHVLTSPYSTKRGDTQAFPEQTYYYGDGDQRLFVDTASGFFYVYYGSRVVDKNGSWKLFYEHVARAPISGKMAPSSWRKFYAGTWSQPGVGGHESNLIPVDAANPLGYTPPADEYKPTTPGTAVQQAAAGTAPPTSPLFVMDITYSAYLGLYIGEPQVVDQSGNAPQQLYWTDNLTTQKWHLLGDTGAYRDASWYRWLVDSGNRTLGTIVGKTFRRYCSIACDSSDGEWADITITGSTPREPFNPVLNYRIATGEDRALSQVPDSSATVSWPASARTDLSNWQFRSNNDGSYTITNASSGHLLGVDSSTDAGRAHGVSPTVTERGASGPTVGQQWFVLANKSPINDNPDGTYRIVNRYSGLVLSLPSTSGVRAETTPVRTWSHQGSTAAQQMLDVVVVPTVTPTTTPTASPTQPPAVFDLYTTPGYHTVNGRKWFTSCEPYSQTTRCRTNIFATQVTQEGGKFVLRNGWVFNNL